MSVLNLSVNPCIPYAAIIFNRTIFSYGSIFQLSDFFGQLVITFLKQLLFQIVPVLPWTISSDQNIDYINDRKPPFALMENFPYLLSLIYCQLRWIVRYSFFSPPLLRAYDKHSLPKNQEIILAVRILFENKTTTWNILAINSDGSDL